MKKNRTLKQEILDSQVAEDNERINNALINERENKFQLQNGDYNLGLDHDVKQGFTGLQTALETIDEAEDLAEAERVAADIRAKEDERQNKLIEERANASDKDANSDRYAKMFADSQDTETAAVTMATQLAEGSEDLQEALKSGEVEVEGIGISGPEQTANAEVQARVEGLKDQEVLRVQRKQAHNLEQDAFEGGTQGPTTEKEHHRQTVHAAEKPFRGYIDDVLEKKRLERERLLEQSKDAGALGESADQRLVDAKKKAEAERMTAVLDRQDSEKRQEILGDAEARQIQKGVETLERIEEEKSMVGENAAYERMKADEHSKTLGLRHRGVGKETPFMTHTRKQDSLAVQLAKHNMPMFMTDEAKKKMAGVLDRIDEERDGGEKEAADQWKKWNKDPFRFSTFAYPRDVTVNQENGHYILFYVNVQNKTKYSYDGITESQHRVPVGDWLMTEEKKERGTGEYEKKYLTGAGDKWNWREKTEEYIDTRWKKGASSEFDTNIDYHKRRVLVGHKGQILRSNQVDLMKGRKSYQGLDSVHKTTTRITDSVALYLPANVTDSTSVGYRHHPRLI